MYDIRHKEYLESLDSPSSTCEDFDPGGEEYVSAMNEAIREAPYWRYGPLPEVKTSEATSLLVTYKAADGRRRIALVNSKFGGSSGPRWAWIHSHIAWCPMPSPCEGDPPPTRR